MFNALSRFLSYYIYLRKAFGSWGACAFMYFYVLARLRGDAGGRLHYIPVGPYVFYFPSTIYFAGLFNEIFFKEEYYLDYTDKPIRAFDCGANIGISLLYIKLRAPNAHVTCFEPNPDARTMLQKNIDANGWRAEVTVVPCALGATSGQAQFYLLEGAQTDSGASLVPRARKQGHALDSYPVSIKPLSKFLTHHVDFLKMDIEGAEFEVMEEVASAGALHHISYIQLEYHHERGLFERPVSDMLKLLEASGFETSVQSTTHPHLMATQNAWRNCLVYAWKKSEVK
jgi:FkbM family methyltransferase